MRVERQHKIVEIVQQNNTISVADICSLFDVSEMTARRDLQELEREGLLRRVHGGAVYNLGRSYEPPLKTRSNKQSEQKRAIGQKAASLIYDGDSIALDVGTTTLEIARALHNKRNLTVLTASLPIANEIVTLYSLESDVRLILTGGVVRAREWSMVGEFTSHLYTKLHVDKAFVGIGGISLEDGLTEYNLEDASVKWALLKSAQQIIVVADGSKFGQTTFATVGPLSAVHTVITDDSAPVDMLDELQAMGIEVLVAG
jgi:DeoR/GlpR family transcriptional regulator of sugar metabolism